MGLQRLEIVVRKENLSRQKVAEKLGAVQQGLLRNRLHINDSACDAYMYSVILKDFGVSKLAYQLLTCHHEYHQQLAKSEVGLSPYYAPDSWIPHCTVEMNIPDEQFQKAIEYCNKAFTLIVGQFQEMGAIE